MKENWGTYVMWMIICLGAVSAVSLIVIGGDTDSRVREIRMEELEEKKLYLETEVLKAQLEALKEKR